MNRRSLLTGSAACAMAAGFPVKPSALPTIRPGDRSFAEYVRRHMDHLASCMVLTFDEVVASYRASEARAVRWYLGAMSDDMRIDVIPMATQVGRTETLMLDEYPYNRFRRR